MVSHAICPSAANDQGQSTVNSRIDPSRHAGAAGLGRGRPRANLAVCVIRLIQARVQVGRIQQDQVLLARQRTQLQQAVASASKILARLEVNTMPGDVSGAFRIQLQSNVFDRCLALLDLDEALFEQKVALQLLLGSGRGIESTVSLQRPGNP